MGRLLDRPPWRDCLAIIKDVSERFGTDPDDVVMCRSRAPDVIRTRRVAIRRILLELKCSQEGLSAVWGIGVTAIRDAMGEVGGKRAIRKTTSSRWGDRRSALEREARANFHARLCWAHGDAKAAQIIAGNDPHTQQDIQAWTRLGGRPGLSEVEGRGL